MFILYIYDKQRLCIKENNTLKTKVKQMFGNFFKFPFYMVAYVPIELRTRTSVFNDDIYTDRVLLESKHTQTR